MKCTFCEQTFVVANKHSGTQKYCSKQCREKHWRQTHKDKVKSDAVMYRKRYQRQKPKYCTICEKVIPINIRKKHNSKVCSEKCYKVLHERFLIRRRYQAECRRKAGVQALYEYKVSKGCSNCGYNKYGGSLDFHHRNPKEKLMRIEAKHWLSKSKAILAELKKCVLLCKNCHYEEHDRMRNQK